MSNQTRPPARTKEARAQARAHVLILLAPILVLPGCIDRKIRVTSDPPGATVWLNDVEIGQTPAEADFMYYGTYDVRLELDGYEPLWTSQKASAPFWQWPGPDLIAEAIPARFDDVVEWHFELRPALETTTDPATLRGELIDRARELSERVEPAATADQAD
ncbi:MAG: PEGA domain-containing protein [Phycisphaeraceae bacterium]|nr:MAG: PEGA domain-containing protein [Phycisphaeraceae bacterium]